MKESNYNFFIDDPENNIHIIYNAFKNTLVNDNDSKVQKFIREAKGDIKFNPDYFTQNEFDELVTSGIIVPKELDEKQRAIDINKKKLDIIHNKKDKLHLVITPTLRCNFKCFYCFESKNTKNSIEAISLELQRDIIDFIQRSITENHIKTVEIIWYGGEPLIKQNIIFSMQKEIKEICDQHQVKLRTDIITNGVLLSPETCETLSAYGVKRVQVTLDGPEHIHNKRRHYPVDPANNYNLILDNILQANEDIQFHIRVNIDKTNVNFIYDLINDLIVKKVWPYKKNVRIYIAQVESSSKTDLDKKEFTVLEDEVRHYLRDKYNEINQTDEAKLYFFYPKFGGETGCGYGIEKNMWVISYNGEVFRCWETVGRKEHVVGTVKDLLEDFGHSIINKIKIDNHTFEKWGCFDCKYFPICGSGCPWDFKNNNEARKCTTWKTVLEYRILSQYKLFLKDPGAFKKAPFKVG